MPFFMAVAHSIWIKTNDESYLALTKTWSKGVAIFFATGAVSGTVLSFELGLLWPKFMEEAGPIIGMPFSWEGTAFFIEAIALGIFLYGWNRIPKHLHWLSGVVVGISGLLSGLIVVCANAWMNTPQGFNYANGKFSNINPTLAMFNPASGVQGVHMAIAAFVAVGFGVSAIHAYGLLKNPASLLHARALKIALLFAASAAILQPIQGDLLAKTVALRQPEKLSAMESLFKTSAPAPLLIGGIPSEESESVSFGIHVPKLLSFLAFGDFKAEVKGLDAFPRDSWPPVAPTHFAFQVMIAIGTLLAIVGVFTLVTMARKSPLLVHPRFLKLLIFCGPLGFLALEAGWIVTEVGRQPWIIYHIMKTKEALTPMPGLVYSLVLVSGIYLLLSVVVTWLMLFMGSHFEDEEVEVIANAIAPVWEANHVWLILAVVICFTAYPKEFSFICIYLHIPLLIMLVALVLLRPKNQPATEISSNLNQTVSPTPKPSDASATPPQSAQALPSTAPGASPAASIAASPPPPQTEIQGDDANGRHYGNHPEIPKEDYSLENGSSLGTGTHRRRRRDSGDFSLPEEKKHTGKPLKKAAGESAKDPNQDDLDWINRVGDPNISAKMTISSVERYKNALDELKDGKTTRSLELVYYIGERAAQDITYSVSHMTRGEYALVEPKMEGFSLDRGGVFKVYPNYKYFQDLASTRGSAGDVGYFETAQDLIKGGVSNYFIPITEFSNCVDLGKGKVVRAFQKWSDFKKRYPKLYSDEVDEKIEEASGELTKTSCVCEGKDTVYKEYRLFFKAFPNSPLTVSLQKRMDDIKDGATPLFYYEDLSLLAEGALTSEARTINLLLADKDLDSGPYNKNQLRFLKERVGKTQVSPEFLLTKCTLTQTNLRNLSGHTLDLGSELLIDQVTALKAMEMKWPKPVWKLVAKICERAELGFYARLQRVKVSGVVWSLSPSHIEQIKRLVFYPTELGKDTITHTIMSNLRLAATIGLIVGISTDLASLEAQKFIVDPNALVSNFLGMADSYENVHTTLKIYESRKFLALKNVARVDLEPLELDILRHRTVIGP
ncbi:unnamed protein product [Sphagnum balticum]